jgi:hypothetical protein
MKATQDAKGNKAHEKSVLYQPHPSLPAFMSSYEDQTEALNFNSV